MLTFTTNDGRKFKIWWRYQCNDEGQHEITDCKLSVKNPDGKWSVSPLYEGRVARHSTDPDSKEVARKGSLAKALKSLPKADREKAWSAYFLRNAPDV